MGLLARLYYRYRRFSKAIALFLMIAGPGIIVMVADNDAGGITTYIVTGSKFGFGLIWFVILLGPVAYVVQEMTVRLGAVTKRGHAEAIFDSFGPFWGWFSLMDLFLVDWLTLITEFIGMTAAMSIFHIPPWATVLCVSILMLIMVLQGRYWTWEKIVLVFCVLNLIYIPAAFLVHPKVSDVLHGLVPGFPGGFGNEIFFFLMANIGTTIAPWMVFFQQSSVVDKRMQEKDIPWGRVDTAVGAVFTVVVAIFCIILAGQLLHGQTIDSAAQAAQTLQRSGDTARHYVGTFLAIGLFDAGLLGAICISLATSWAVGEVFGWAHSLNNKIREAPWFYAVYALALFTAGTVVLVSSAKVLITITLFVQVIAVTLLPAALVFLLLLLNDGKVMGKFKNTLSQNIIGFTIVIAICILSTLYVVSALFPSVFK